MSLVCKKEKTHTGETFLNNNFRFANRFKVPTYVPNHTTIRVKHHYNVNPPLPLNRIN